MQYLFHININKRNCENGRALEWPLPSRLHKVFRWQTQSSFKSLLHTTHHLSLSLLPPTMASLLQNHIHSSLSSPIPNLRWTPNLHPSRPRPHFSAKPRVLTFRVSYKSRLGVSSFRCFCSSGTELQNASLQQQTERRPFDINLAVILAGFAFEAYTSPPVIWLLLTSFFFVLDGGIIFFLIRRGLRRWILECKLDEGYSWKFLWSFIYLFSLFWYRKILGSVKLTLQVVRLYIFQSM